MRRRKKLIEVALPLEAINVASAREKSIRHGHPSTLHLWWARRPLAAARAVIFSQVVDDPSEFVDELLADTNKRSRAASELEKRLVEWQAKEKLAPGTPMEPEPTLEEVAADLERDRLFKLIEDLVQWENTTNEEVLEKARREIWKSWGRTCADYVDHPQASELFNPEKLPAFHDPFAGGGALPLEAQRLGLEAHASDLNPVAVLINKAMIEIPPRFAGQAPVNPDAREKKSLFEREWKGAEGLAEDVRYYGQWMRDEAEKRIGHLYPKVEISEDMVKERPDLEPYKGRELTVIAWLWARTVKSPNPAFSGVDVPLVASFILSSRKGKEVCIEPRLESKGYRFTIKVGKPKDSSASRGTKSGKGGSNFLCLMSQTPMSFEYLRKEAKDGRMGSRLLAIVAEGDRERVYLDPLPEHELVARQAQPTWKPDVEFFQKALGFRVGNYGMTRWSDIFTDRQLVALATFCDLQQELQRCVGKDALAAEMSADSRPIRDGGFGAKAYGEALMLYLAMVTDKCCDYWSSICSWHSSGQKMRNTFGRQAIPMVWDYAEANPFGNSTGNWTAMVEWTSKAVGTLPAIGISTVEQDAAQSQSISTQKVVSTDPPYFDNVGYSDLSDFFYVWMRHSLQHVFPSLFSTLVVPKREELVATPARHGGRDGAEAFFLGGMAEAMQRLAELAHAEFPVTIYYAFKQAENETDSGTSSSGWQTFLEAVIQAGFEVGGTWPVRTELGNRMRGTGWNALASSIVLVCSRRMETASDATRREFIGALKSELPVAIRHLQRANLAPVDLAQAAIGPGMAVYTRYSQVLESDGTKLGVRTALALINQVLDEVLAEQEGDFDSDTRWALAWFEQMGFEEGEYGIAESLSKAKNTSVSGLEDAGILSSKSGKVRLLSPDKLSVDWDPTKDPRLTTWEMVHHLIRALESDGESAAAELVTKLGPKAETARELCYRLFTLCERKKRATEAVSYNALVQSWPEITRLARAQSVEGPRQTSFLD